MQHARAELERIGEDSALTESICASIGALTAFGHSGGSMQITIEFVNKLLRRETLAPITDLPEEWNEVEKGLWQNTRNTRLFSEDMGRSYWDVDSGRRSLRRSQTACGARSCISPELCYKPNRHKGDHRNSAGREWKAAF